MKGRAPIRRTIEYLTSGNLVLKEQIKVVSINYNTFGSHHDGARLGFVNIFSSFFHIFLLFPCRDFVFWNLPKLQYKNPGVQVVTFKNMTPSPFIRCYFGLLLFPPELCPGGRSH